MSIVLADITRTCDQPNARSINNIIYVCLKSDVTAIGAEQAYPSGQNEPRTIATNLTMDTLKVFKKWTLSKFDKSLEIEAEGNEDGSIFVHKLTGFFPKQSALKTYLLGGMTNGCEMIVIAKDKNGNTRLIGDLIEGAILKAKEINNNDKNGYEIEFTWESALPAPYYTGTIAL
jgi:hypothetical protein